MWEAHPTLKVIKTKKKNIKTQNADNQIAKNQLKRETLGSSHRNKTYYTQRSKDKTSECFYSEIMQAKRKWYDTFYMLKEKQYNIKFLIQWLYSSKIVTKGLLGTNRSLQNS